MIPGTIVSELPIPSSLTHFLFIRLRKSFCNTFTGGFAPWVIPWIRIGPLQFMLVYSCCLQCKPSGVMKGNCKDQQFAFIPTCVLYNLFSLCHTLSNTSLVLYDLYCTKPKQKAEVRTTLRKFYLCTDQV